MDKAKYGDNSTTISFKLSKLFKSRIDELAKYIGISRSELIRQALFEYITEKIVKMRCIMDGEKNIK